MAAPKKASAKKEKVEPVLERITVSAGAAVTANLGNYESYKSSVTVGEEYTVAGLTQAEVDEFVEERQQALKEKADEVVEAEYAQNSIYAKRGVKGKK